MLIKKRREEPLESKDDERTRGEERCNKSNKVVRERLKIDTRSFFPEASKKPGKDDLFSLVMTRFLPLILKKASFARC